MLKTWLPLLQALAVPIIGLVGGWVRSRQERGALPMLERLVTARASAPEVVQQRLDPLLADAADVLAYHLRRRLGRRFDPATLAAILLVTGVGMASVYVAARVSTWWSWSIGGFVGVFSGALIAAGAVQVYSYPEIEPPELLRQSTQPSP